MAAFKILTVGEKEYRLKLNTNATILIEDKLGGNILDPILSMASLNSNLNVKANETSKEEVNKGLEEEIHEVSEIKEVSNMTKIPMPSLKYCVTILWGSLQKFHHGMTFAKTCDLVDEYIEEGKTQLDLFTEVMNLLTESGIMGTPEEAKENLN
ncbi:DUF6096 family protein [uncultured Clostridium sp.]|uniref:DUF6096 family protein n=1 Tax=uncultured Clostridium sp. TaxID=59620 RepID=UPI00272F43DA|nr:DUF6096 family protein [uncultured Clostridium sp.]